ncbi:MAG: phosphoribosylglycinamide formyltransferase [Calditrichaeota bacterium]|nr:MAG: phosphoribosylglycinamide formyltransferase [Calditrichota bacterium]
MRRRVPLRLAAFASGRGSNLAAILEKIDTGKLDAQVVLVLSNNSDAGALDIARQHGIPAMHISRKQFNDDQTYENALLTALADSQTELVILAGYMKKIPVSIVRTFQGRMLNIHPALLPSFGGQGLYGHFVHEAVLAFGCKVSGVTVHLVDAQYDTGAPVMQRSVPVLEEDTAETLAARILKEEHQIYAEAIQLFAEGRVRLDGRRTKILPPEFEKQP